MLTLSGLFVTLLMLGITGQSLIGGVFLVEMIPSRRWSWLLGIVAIALLWVHFFAYYHLWRAWFVNKSIAEIFFGFGYQIVGVAIVFALFFTVRHFCIKTRDSWEMSTSKKIDF